MTLLFRFLFFQFQTLIENCYYACLLIRLINSNPVVLCGMSCAGKCGGKVIECDKEKFQLQQLEHCTQVTFPLKPLSPSLSSATPSAPSTLLSPPIPARDGQQEISVFSSPDMPETASDTPLPLSVSESAVSRRDSGQTHDRPNLQSKLKPKTIPWVPLDRELFCCEKCFQVSGRTTITIFQLHKLSLFVLKSVVIIIIIVVI